MELIQVAIPKIDLPSKSNTGIIVILFLILGVIGTFTYFAISDNKTNTAEFDETEL